MRKRFILALVIIIMLSSCNSRTANEIPHTASQSSQNLQSSQSESNIKELDDSYFIERTYEIIQLLGISNIQKEEITIARQESEYYNRYEVIASFSQNEQVGNVSFNQETGALFEITCFDFEFSEISGYNKDAPEEKAAEYYETLPVPQGYVLTSSDYSSETYGMYRFSRELSEGIYTQYEQVVILMDTDTGHFLSCTVHDFPLTNEQNHDENALTQDKAQAVAQALINQRWPDWPGKLKTAEISVILPNWRYTEHYIETVKYPDNSYLAWQLEFENVNSETSDMLKLYIDLYTGDVLGGDSTGILN